MKYIMNCLLILALKTLKKIGRSGHLKSKIFSSQKILEKNFKINSTFSFIQVGANDGVSFDFLYEFVTKRNSIGVVIEPILEYFNELEANYKEFPKIIKINKALHPIEKKITIYKITPNAIDKYPDWVKGIASIDPNHHKKCNIKTEDIIKEYVESEDLMTIVNGSYESNVLDYFQIDTEGFDYEIIKMLDFEKVKPKIIKYESVNLNIETQLDTISLLKKEGYYIFHEFGDTIGINLHKIKLI